MSRGQSPVQELIESRDDGVGMIALVGLQEPPADQLADFRFAQLDHEAAKPVAATTPVAPHTLGGGRDRRWDCYVGRHFRPQEQLYVEIGRWFEAKRGQGRGRVKRSCG